MLTHFFCCRFIFHLNILKDVSCGLICLPVDIFHLKVVKEVSGGGGAKQLVLNYHMGALGQVVFMYFVIIYFSSLSTTTWEHMGTGGPKTLQNIYPLHDFMSLWVQMFKSV